jgi:GPI mannosyltransferase 3
MRMFYGCLLFRLSCALLICTSFVPDEYYQGVEPAYRSVYGKGIVTWEWEDAYRLRSFVGILPYMGLFKVFKEVGVHSQWLHAVGPRLVQAVFASVADACLYRIASSHSAVTGLWTMMLHLGNWYWTYSATRTLANTNEACVFIVVLYLWYCTSDAGGGRGARLYAALALLCLQCYARPTSALLFLPLLVDRLLMFKKESVAGVVRYCGSCVVVGVLCVALGVCIDTYFYHHFHHEQGWVWTATPYNFYVINVHARVSSLFGIHSWHWNATSGLPTVLGLAFPALCVAVGWYIVDNGGKMIMERRRRRTNGSGVTYSISTCMESASASNEAAEAVKLAVIAVVLYPLGLHVFSAHQEMRFLAPVLPAAHLVLGVAIEGWRRQAEGSQGEGDVKSQSQSQSQPQSSLSSSCRCR